MSTVTPGSNQVDDTVFALLESFAEAVFLINTEGVILNANSVFTATFGKHPHECIGTNVFDLIAVDLQMPELADQGRKKIRAVLQTGKREVFEDEINNLVWKVTINPVVSPEGEITRLLVITEDISEQKRAETELQKECALKTAVLDEMPGCAAVLDADGRLIVWNQYARQLLLGKTENQSRNVDYKKIISADDLFPVKEKFQNILNSGADDSSEVRIQPPGSENAQWIAARGRRIVIEGQQCIVAVGMDISEQKRLEEELKESETRLSQALHAARAGAWEWNLKTNESNWSDELWQLCGLEQADENPSLELWVNTIHPDDRQMAIETVTTAAENKIDLNLEYRVFHPDGSVHWLMSRGRPLDDENGQTTHYIGTVIDITERKKMEQDLTESKKRLTFALEATDAGVWEWDLKTDKVFWSNRIWTLYGLEPNSLPPSHKLCESTVHPDDREKTFQAIMAAASREIEINVEYRVCHQDGSIHWLMCRGMPLCEGDDGMTRYIGTVMDINERKKIDTALKENESKFRSIFDHAPLAISIEDIQSGRLIDANASWLQLLGYHREEVMNKSASDIGLYANTSEYESISRSLSEHDRVINKPLQLRKRSGKLINVLYFSEVITLKDRQVLLVMMTDITLQKLQQRNINQLETAVADRTKKLQEEIKRLQRFLSMISHEYRTPLAIIRTNLDLLKIKSKMGDFSNKKELSKINRAIDRLVEVLEVSIQDSRISESQEASASIQFQIAPVITSQVEVFRNIWLERSIRYSECLDRCIVSGEQSQIKFAIFNLLDNARKFSPPDSTIEVKCCIEDDEAVIRIRNQGTSITQDEAETFFEKYQRGNNSSNTAGAGLGLWLVRNIINQHDGQVTLEGTEFGVEATIRLPIVTQSGSNGQPD